jgi:hypothetical protein
VPNRLAIEWLMNHSKVVDDWTQSLSLSNKLVTPLEYFSIQNNQRRGKQKEKTSLAFTRLLAGYLNKVSVNPNDPLRTSLIEKYFVLGREESEAESIEGIPINSSEDSIESWVKRWVTHAKNISNEYRPNTDLNDANEFVSRIEPDNTPRFQIVLGERGVGKTFFQNFVLTKYCNYFDTQKVIWVRINLVRAFGSDDLNFWIKSQIAKVLTRYYDIESKRYNKNRKHDIAFHFSETLSTKMRSASEQRRDTATRMLEIFRYENPASDRDINAAWVDPAAVDYIFERALEDGVGFIVVIDGLDLLDHSEGLKRNFEEQLERVRTYLSESTPLWRFNLIFMRPESYPQFESMVLRKIKHVPDELRNTNFLKLLPVDLNELFEKRFATLDSTDLAKTIGYHIDQIREFKKFLENIECGEAKDGTALTYKKWLSDVFGNNTRAATQVLHAAAHEFMLHDGGKKTFQHSLAYHFIDLTMRAGGSLPPAAYRYKKIVRHNETIYERTVPPAGVTVYDSTFLPSIFRFPYGAQETVDLIFNGTGHGNLLLGLRILQFARVFVDKRSQLGALTLSGLVNVVSSVFQLEVELVRALVEEFMDDELLYPWSTKEFSPPEIGNRYLMLSPKGRTLLDKFLFDIAYLNVASYNLPLPQNLLRDQPSPMYFNALPIDEHTDVVDTVKAKLLNSISLWKLVEHVNCRQKLSAIQNMEALTPKHREAFKIAIISVSPAHLGMFEFPNVMKESLIKVGAVILNSLRQRPNKKLYQTLHSELRLPQ